MASNGLLANASKAMYMVLNDKHEEKEAIMVRNSRVEPT
jgi:hypothetical protein